MKPIFGIYKNEQGLSTVFADNTIDVQFQINRD